MHHQGYIAVLVSSLLIWAVQGSLADSDLWSAYTQSGLEARNKGDYKRAEELFSAAVREADNGGKSDDKLCDSLNTLAVLLVDAGKPENAEPLFKRVLSIQEAKLPPDNLDLARTMSNLAMCYQQQGKLSDAEPLSRRTLAIVEKQLGKDGLAASVVLNNLGMILQDELRYEESELLLKRSLKIRETTLGPDDGAVGTVLNNLALLACKQGKYKDAESLYRRSLAIWEKALGPDHPDCALCMNNLASMLDDQGRWAEAEALYRQALAIREKSLGDGNSQVAISLNNLGLLLARQGRYAEAEPFYRRAISIQQRALGAEHPNLALILQNLADVYTAQGQFAQAEVVCRQSLQITEKAFGPTHPRVAAALRELSRLSGAQGQSAAKERSERQAETITHSLPGGEHRIIPDVTPTAPSASKPNRPIKDKWALVVGISSFKDPTLNLKYAAKDAIDFRNYLVADGHFQPDHVKLLTDRMATRDNIVNSLGERWLTRVANRDDLVVVYISSHGSAAKHDIAGVNMLVAHDTNIDNQLATGIPMEWLTQIIKDQVHCDRVVLILDVCHSGAAQTSSKGLTRRFDFDPDHVGVGSGQIVVCSSQANQVSWESARYANSVFTRKLIEGLRQKGANTKLFEAVEFMRDRVEEEVLRDRAVVQTPVLRKMWDGNDLILATSPVSPRKGLTDVSTSDTRPKIPAPGRKSAAKAK